MMSTISLWLNDFSAPSRTCSLPDSMPSASHLHAGLAQFRQHMRAHGIDSGIGPDVEIVVARDQLVAQRQTWRSLSTNISSMILYVLTP